LVAAFGRLDVGLESSGSQQETADRRLHSDSVGRASERLAISAVTNPHSVRVDLRFKGNLSAVATVMSNGEGGVAVLEKLNSIGVQIATDGVSEESGGVITPAVAGVRAWVQGWPLAATCGERRFSNRPT
jgi:hypothetical protein